MESFRDLFIRCGPDQFDALMMEVEKSLPEGWVRDLDAEAHMRAGMISKRSNYCFASPLEGPVPTATLFLFEKTPGVFYVSNIVPRIKSELSYQEYNSVLRAFADSIVRPIADRMGVSVELTKDQLELEDFLTPDTTTLLKKFSTLANKSTGSSHPLDQERWMQFVVAAHQDASEMDVMTLRRWLMEVEGWPSDTADQLASEYEFGRALLSAYDRES